jgi:hypothetical protein
MKIIGIIGTRRRDGKEAYYKIKEKFLQVYEVGDIICSGHCSQGGDRFAEVLISKYKTGKLIFPANWKKYGKGAGFIRNTDIAENSDILIACVAKDRKGGTEDTIKKYLKRGKKKLFLV